MLRAKSNQPVAALEAIDRALRLQPGFAPALFYRGNVYLSQGQAAQAAQAYQEAVSADPQNRTYIEALNNARRALAGPAPR
jgi:tetratricopeptide (TPR) repeat protein